MSDAYAAGAKEDGAEVQELHLVEMKFDPVLWGGDKSTQTLEPDLVKAQEFIKWADHVVFVIPVWWQNMPAILKGFIDRVFLPGFAYEFTSKNKWDKFLPAKTARFIVTTGGPALYYKFVLRSPLNKLLGRDVLKFCGFTEYKATVIGGLADATPELCTGWLEKIKNLGRKQA